MKYPSMADEIIKKQEETIDRLTALAKRLAVELSTIKSQKTRRVKV